MVMDDVESLSRFIDPQVAFDFDFIKSALSSDTTSDHRCSVPSCTDITSGDDTSTLLDFFSDPSIELKSGIQTFIISLHFLNEVKLTFSQRK
ncbi:uncharacterized protein NPIL_186291 [Nephila pilipes]|uniref:Uncharacterized protein n=1 Tax=Nephila pilipes TaxID=299642 RepID=A0A8X6MNG5_NEPPI|nr:uncharacterized protein NPIL_186291 [Nephila pilipes]